MSNVHELPNKSEPGGIAHDKRKNDGITLPMTLCNNRIFAGAMQKMEEHTGWHTKTTYNFVKLAEAFERATTTYQKAFRKLVFKHAEMETEMQPSTLVKGEMVPVTDPKTGKPKTKPKIITRGPGRSDYVWKDTKAWLKDFHALGRETFHVKAFKLTGEEMLEAGLSPRELRMCVMIQEDADPDVLQSYQDSLAKALADELEAAEDPEDADDEESSDAGSGDSD